MKCIVPSLFMIFLSLVLQAQDAGLAEYSEKTFNSGLGLNFNTTETLEKGNLSFHLGHRFGRISSGYQGFFGLDESASWRLEFNYGLTDNLTVGIARNSLDKLHDAYIKYRLLRQMEDDRIPITLTLLPRIGINGTEFNETEEDIYSFRHRMNYALSVFVGRKLTEKSSVQLFPMIIHENLTDREEQNNTFFALGGLYKLKVSRTTSILVEYAHNLSYQEATEEDYYGNFAIGLDFTTYSHNFSLMLSNTVFMVENQAIPFNNGNFFGNEIHIGFNISRNFVL